MCPELKLGSSEDTKACELLYRAERAIFLNSNPWEMTSVKILVCLFLISEPIGHKFVVATHMTPGKVYRRLQLKENKGIEYLSQTQIF